MYIKTLHRVAGG